MPLIWSVSFNFVVFISTCPAITFIDAILQNHYFNILLLAINDKVQWRKDDILTFTVLRKVLSDIWCRRFAFTIHGGVREHLEAAGTLEALVRLRSQIYYPRSWWKAMSRERREKRGIEKKLERVKVSVPFVKVNMADLLRLVHSYKIYFPSNLFYCNSK